MTRASTSLVPRSKEAVDGRVKPGHDAEKQTDHFPKE
jgi:hypothetical protein